ncbi:hypothetical protein E3P99_02167 [Wallemia hederae]|uniref:Mitochondrial inner membrane protease subunit n=1 Tax=Wallemia hederae TaxID=1540922 RepID=A0A4T0FL10_9BASI|nr:hypothetical protein E3P99_02167 [Wallemia hederae]
MQLSYGISMIPTIESSGAWLLHEPNSVKRGLQSDDQNVVRHSTQQDTDTFWQQLSKEYGTGVRRGDLVVALTPDQPDKSVCKRIIGFPGDTILRDPLCLHLHNHPHNTHDQDSRYVHVPKNHVWLAGDNLTNSRDSRSYGPVPVSMLRGKVFAKYADELQVVHQGNFV